MQYILNNHDNGCVDFLFIYETKVREFESICLIAQELIKRGYCVGIQDMWTPLVLGQKRFLRTKVLITSALYKEKSLKNALLRVKGKTRVVNMQWEQVYSVRDLKNPDAPWKFEGDVRKATHLSWGEVNCCKLIEEDHVKPSNVCKVGHVGLDFLRPSMRGFYFSREELFQKCNIDMDTRVCLFISSFSLVNLPENIWEGELKEFIFASIESQREVLDWIMQVLEEQTDITFIYRPHPAEAHNPKILQLQKKNTRFKVISEYSVKQWILAADVIYNWYSTSMAEIYYAGKSCFMLRPQPIPPEFECLIFEGVEAIDNYEAFRASIHEKVCNLPIPLENITNNYYVDKEEPTYIKIANVLESVWKNNGDCFECKPNWKEIYSNKKLLLKNCKIGKKLLNIIGERGGKKALVKDREYASYINEMMINNAISEEEMMAMMEKLGKLA